MELTFQVPMQYCPLQHQTLLPSPVTSTTGCCFCFGSIPSFFLELFLHWSPVAYWASTNPWSSPFSIVSFCLFHTVHGILKARILKWFAIPFSSGPHSVRPLHHDLPVLENFEHHFTSVWDECNCVVVWALFGIAFCWDWNENWPFPVLWPLLSFPQVSRCPICYWRSVEK